MKLQSIYVENYGLFHERELNFHDQLQVIYGPNEAGKSTLLQLIREALFGFPHQSPYRWRPTVKMAATVSMSLTNGEVFQYRRQKGQPDDVSGQFLASAKKIESHDELVGLFSNATVDTFTNLFGFSLDELSKGQESLKNSSLGDLLLTGGVNGLEQFQHVQKELLAQQQEIFTAKAKTRKLNDVHHKLKDAKTRYQNQRIAPREFDLLVHEKETSQSRVTELSKSLIEYRMQEKRLDRFVQALPLQRSINLLQTEINQLALPESLTPATLSRVESLLNQVRGLSLDIETLQKTIDQTSHEEELNATAPIDAQLLAHASNVQKLAQDVKQIRAFLAEQKTDQEGIRTLQRTIDQKLSELGSDWTIDKVQSLQLTLALRKQLDELLEEELKLNTAQVQLDARIPDLKQQWQSVSVSLDALSVTPAPTGLEDILERADDYTHNCRVLSEVNEELSVLNIEMQSLSSELGTLLQDQHTNWNDIQVPLKATLKKWADKLTKAINKQQKVYDQREEKQAALKQLELNLLDFDQTHPSLDQETLLQVRQQRDQGLRFMVDKLQLENLKKTDPFRTELAKHILEWIGEAPQDFEARLLELVAQADQIADSRISQAESVAKRDHLVRECAQIEIQVAELDEKLAEAQTALQTMETEWLTVWQPSQITPLSPPEMQEWSQIYEQWSSLSKKQALLDQKRTTLSSANSNFESELRAAFPNYTGSQEQLMRDAVKSLRESQTNQAEYQRLKAEEKQLSLKLNELDSERAKLFTKTELHSKGKNHLFQQVGFSESWSLKVGQKLLGIVLETQRDLTAKSDLSENLQQKQTQIDAFNVAANEIILQLDHPPIESELCDAIEALYQKVDQEQQRSQANAKSIAIREDNLRRLAQFTAQKTDAMHELKTLQDSTKLATLEDLEQLVLTAREVQSLGAQLRTQQQQLLTVAVDFNVLLQEFGEEETALQTRIEELKLQTQVTEQEYAKALQEVGVAQDRIDKLAQQSGDDSALKQWTHYQSLFNALVQNWSALALSQIVLSQAQARYEKENQPEMMRLVSNYLERMTDGRYIGIQTDQETRNGLVILTKQGTLKRSEELSTGTREQLYLAVRLGYLTHYAEKHEPLPLVMDDVLVNFDDERALQTLSVLQECSSQHQILLLSCHSRTVELMRKLNSEAHILELQPGTFSQAEITKSGQSTRQTKRRQKPDAQSHPALFPQS